MRTLTSRRKVTTVGAQWEKEVFGIASAEHSGFERHHPFDLAIENAKNTQEKLGWDPSRPKTEVARELCECVKSHLPQYTQRHLMFYCSIGTGLDHYHGVDGFFELDFDGQRIDVFIDLTTNNSKVSKPTVDVIFHREDSYRRLWRVAKQISDRFLNRLAKNP